MKITVSDVQMIDWDKAAEKIKAQAVKAITDKLDEAMKALPDLQPGQSKTFTIKLGSISIRRSKD